MTRLHDQEKEQFRKLFIQENIDRFEDRFKVLETFLKTEQHVTDEELCRLVNTNGHKLEPEFIQDTLKLMCRFGFAQANRFDNGIPRYEHRHLGQHHDHMICTKCRGIIEFKNDEMERLQKHIADENGFLILQHRMEIYGICTNCLQDRVQAMSLADARQGERLTIREFTGGAGFRIRLLSMGLRIGDEIEVITNLGGGQVVIAADYQRLAIGRNQAGKILVDLVAGDA